MNSYTLTDKARRALHTYLRGILGNGVVLKPYGVNYIGAKNDNVEVFTAVVRIEREDEHDDIEYTTYLILVNSEEQTCEVSVLRAKYSQTYSYADIEFDEYEQFKAAVIEGYHMGMDIIAIAKQLTCPADAVTEILNKEVVR